MNAKRRVLVTGACGLLGSHLMVSLARHHEVVGVDRHPWWGDHPATVLQGDLATPGFLTTTVARASPDVIVHCAAMANVDACERHPELAYACNATITRELARAAPSHVLVVYITTDGLFQGDRSFATEEQVPCPRTVYARSKLHGEWDVALTTPHHLIVRTNFYGWSSGRKQTAAEWLYHALEVGEPVTLFDDFFFTPIYVVDFVQRLERLMMDGHRGVFHVVGKDRVSKYQFGAMLAEASGFSMQRVTRGSINASPMAADRPKDMSLSSARFEAATGLPSPECMVGIQRFLGDRDRPLSARFDAIGERYRTVVS